MLLDRALRGDERRRRSVRQPGRVAGRDAPAGAERRSQRRERLHRRVGPEELIAVGNRPAVVREDGHRHDDVVHHALVPGLSGASLGLDRVSVGRLPRQVREGVVEVLRRLPHDGRGVVDDPLCDEAGVEVDVGAHRVVAHVLDAADEDDLGGTHRDLARTSGRRSERAGAHPVDGEAGNRRRQPCEERNVAPEREALVAHLRGRGEDDVVDPVRRELRVPAKHLAHGLHGHVVRARLREEPVCRRPAERRAHAVDVDHIAKLRHGRDDTSEAMVDWEERAERARARYEDGVARLPDDSDERQRQLTRMGNAAWAAGLSLLMSGRGAEANEWLIRAAETYRESWPDAPPGSWGRPIGAMKSRLIAGDLAGAQDDASWALDAGAAASESPIGRYAAALAHLVRDEDADAARLAATLAGEAAIPPAVAASVAALTVRDASVYETAIRSLVGDFEAREEFLEDIPVADTVLAFQALAAERGISVALSSPLLPG